MQGLAGDMGRAVADGLAADLSQAELIDAVNGVIDKGEGAQWYVDEAVHTAMQQAALGLYEQTGIALVDYVTEGDARVCPICEGYEAESPWPLTSVPSPPVHGGCRCFVVPIAGGSPD